MKITEPGIYEVSREEYDADCAPVPSLSASIAKLILERSPAHARLMHPRLNPAHEKDHERKFDLGNVVHALMLGEADKVVSIAADDFRSKAAREARDEAIASGKIPMLGHKLETALEMVAAVWRQLKDCEDGEGVFDPLHGKGERTAVWEEDGTWFRIRPDWLPNAGNVVFDLKTTAASANPEQWVRTMYDQGGDVQAALYIRGLHRLAGRIWQWRWVVIETEPPYALSICAPSPAMLELGNVKVERAISYWRWCMAKNKWPGYPRDTAHLDVLPWEEKRMLERIERENVARESGPELIERAIAMYAPDHMKEKAA